MPRFFPIALLFALLVAGFALGYTDYLSVEYLQNHKESLLAFVQKHPVHAAAGYIGVYIFIAATSFPGASLVTLAGGFLFPQPFSTLYTVLGATIGATIVFMAARYAFAETFRRTLGQRLHRLEEGFLQDPAGYMLFLRLVPLFPFWVVNIAPAFTRIGLFTYTWTTFLGIIPGTFAYCQAGRALESALESHQILNGQMQIALAALAVISLIPVIYKRYGKTK